jgi:hypothetical protein
MDILLQVKPRNKKASGKVELQCSAVPVIYNRLARTANFILLLVRAQNQIDKREIYENYAIQLDVAHLIETSLVSPKNWNLTFIFLDDL